MFDRFKMNGKMKSNRDMEACDIKRHKKQAKCPIKFSLFFSSRNFPICNNYIITYRVTQQHSKQIPLAKESAPSFYTAEENSDQNSL